MLGAPPLGREVDEQPQLLGWAGSQGRLGAEFDNDLGRRHPPAPRDVLPDELVLLELDLAGAARELGGELIGDADDLPLRIAVGAAFAEFPLDADDPAESVGQQCVVVRGQSGDGGEHRPAVEAAPAAVHHGQHLVGHHLVGVELWIPGTGVESAA